jgi:CIC family chloride channel protein
VDTLRPTLPWFRFVNRLFIATRRVVRNDQVILAALAVIIGVTAAVGEIAFRAVLRGVQWLFYGSASQRLAGFAEALPWWHLLLAPAVGGLLLGLFLRYVMPGRQPQAVPHVMEACALRGGRMSLRTGLAAAFYSAASLGAGASAGREGPIVHLGASLASAVARRLKLSANLSRTLLGCGVAAAVAASFNAPIAGVFFALEVVVGHYALSAFTPIVIASVVGTVVSRLHYGDFPAFILPESYRIASYLEFPAFALLGLVCGAVAMVFMWAVITADTLVGRINPPLALRPALAGLLVGMMAIWFPDILGVGYETTDAALRENLTLELMLTLIVVKTVATAITLGGGFGGGVFSPSLFVGAMTGGAFGVIATGVFPEVSSGHGAYTLVGMGAVAGAVLGAPMSTILIVFEMTGDYEMAIALMVGVVLSTTLSQVVLGRSLFTWQLERRGVSLHGGREIGLLKQIRVADVMKDDYTAVGPDADLYEIGDKLADARWGELFVVDGDGCLVGVINMADMATAEQAPGEGDAPRTAADIARRDPPMLQADEELREAIGFIDRAGESHLPVVDTRERRFVVGFVHEHDVLLAYHRALLTARAEERGEPLPEPGRRLPWQRR